MQQRQFLKIAISTEKKIVCYSSLYKTGSWNNCKNAANDTTARYAEYKSIGPGVNTALRVLWSKQLTDEDVKKISLKNILDKWNIYEK